ncbi:MAG: hypothetical protein DMD81_05795 [Candidatus Rokuibacteriota bacterium]|nr:MAG: hypothetical protein DMD81_05795 [Candidatus Rokubacteria bacterium]
MLRASAPASRGGTRIPVSPSATASGLPPTRVAMTGFPAAMDSSTALENPSLRDGSTEIATSDRISGTSCRRPVKMTRSASPRRFAYRSSS